MDDDHFLNKLGKVISHKSYLVISGLGFLFKGLFGHVLNIFRLLDSRWFQVGSEEAKCREGLRVTYESEIEVMGFVNWEEIQGCRFVSYTFSETSRNRWYLRIYIDIGFWGLAA